MSTPMTFPLDPTLLAAIKTSIPPPDPRSRTVSPSLSDASATGLPQPSPMFAASGTFLRSTSVYPIFLPISVRFPVSQQEGEQQHEPWVWAIEAYLSLTTFFVFFLSIDFHFFLF